MLKKLFALFTVCVVATSCASWFTSSQEIPDNPIVGGRQDSSDMLFGQAESSTSSTTNTVASESAPMAATSAPASAKSESSAPASAGVVK